MKAKLIKESLYENKSNTSNSFGEKKCLQLVKKYMPYLKNVTWDDLGDRGTQDNPIYGQDEQYQKWDQLSFEIGIESIDAYGASLYLIQDFDSDVICAKIYVDATAYTGYGDINDEYVDELPGIPLDEWDEERYNSVIDDLKENYYYDEEE